MMRMTDCPCALLVAAGAAATREPTRAAARRPRSRRRRRRRRRRADRADPRRRRPPKPRAAGAVPARREVRLHGPAAHRSTSRSSGKPGTREDEGAQREAEHGASRPEKEIQGLQDKMKTAAGVADAEAVINDRAASSTGCSARRSSWQQDAQAQVDQLNQELLTDFRSEGAAASSRRSARRSGLWIIFATRRQPASRRHAGLDLSLRSSSGSTRPSRRRQPRPVARATRHSRLSISAAVRQTTLSYLSSVACTSCPVLERLTYRYPSVLVDAVTEHEPGRRIVAVKNVTVNEEFFQGHFPGTPLMPGVLMIESLTQVATLLLLRRAGRDAGCAWLRGVDNAKFRRQVVPGDRLELEVTLGRRRGRLVRAAAVASVAASVVAEAELVLAVEPGHQLRSGTASCAARCHHPRHRDRPSERAHRRGHGHRAVRDDRSARRHRQALPGRRVERRRRLDGDRRRHARSIRSPRSAWRRRT